MSVLSSLFDKKKKLMYLSVEMHIPVLQRQVSLSEFKVSLEYKVSIGTTVAT